MIICIFASLRVFVLYQILHTTIRVILRSTGTQIITRATVAFQYPRVIHTLIYGIRASSAMKSISSSGDLNP